MKSHRLNEYFDSNGNLHSFVCSGHLDSTFFRDQCEKQYAVRPRIVNHFWHKSKWIKKDPERKHSRGYLTHISLPHFEFGAEPVTIGLVVKTPIEN
ncbi:MAG: hypothetical protein GY866_21145 [Proteobacteria bacterium]|nr:hypothetical protein [Pseudomonadota bacterium]